MPSSSSIPSPPTSALSDGLQPGHQLLDPHAGATEATVELVDDVGGPLQLVDQAVDVDHPGLELLDDRVELRAGVRITEAGDLRSSGPTLTGCACGHD